MRRSLKYISPGHRVRVVDIANSALRPKLLEMGLVIGKEISVLFKAPFGDPIAIDVQGYVLSLRLDEADLIDVEEIKNGKKG